MTMAPRPMGPCAELVGVSHVHMMGHSGSRRPINNSTSHWTQTYWFLLFFNFVLFGERAGRVA